jgi:hypothetical protein
MGKVLAIDEIERLTAIKDELGELLREARRIVRETSEEELAHRYWLAAIEMALDNNHAFLGRSMHTMQETIDALDEEYLHGEYLDVTE